MALKDQVLPIAIAFTAVIFANSKGYVNLNPYDWMDKISELADDFPYLPSSEGGPCSAKQSDHDLNICMAQVYFQKAKIEIEAKNTECMNDLNAAQRYADAAGGLTRAGIDMPEFKQAQHAAFVINAKVNFELAKKYKADKNDAKYFTSLVQAVEYVELAGGLDQAGISSGEWNEVIGNDYFAPLRNDAIHGSIRPALMFA